MYFRRGPLNTASYYNVQLCFGKHRQQKKNIVLVQGMYLWYTDDGL